MAMYPITETFPLFKMIILKKLSLKRNLIIKISWYRWTLLNSSSYIVPIDSRLSAKKCKAELANAKSQNYFPTGKVRTNLISAKCVTKHREK